MGHQFAELEAIDIICIRSPAGQDFKSFSSGNYGSRDVYIFLKFFVENCCVDIIEGSRVNFI